MFTNYCALSGHRPVFLLNTLQVLAVIYFIYASKRVPIFITRRVALFIGGEINVFCSGGKIDVFCSDQKRVGNSEKTTASKRKPARQRGHLFCDIIVFQLILQRVNIFYFHHPA